MKNPREILITASSDMQDALELGGQAGKDRYWKVVDTAFAQLEEYYHNCIRGQHQMVGENGMGATHCKICNLKVSELEKIYRMMSKEK